MNSFGVEGSSDEATSNVLEWRSFAVDNIDKTRNVFWSGGLGQF